MSSIADLVTAEQANSSGVAAAVTALQNLVALVESLQQQVATLQAAQGLSADEQSELDSSVASLGTDDSSLAAAVTAAEAVLNPPAPTEPAPAEEPAS
jgi:hypothetical protein